MNTDNPYQTPHSQVNNQTNAFFSRRGSNLLARHNSSEVRFPNCCIHCGRPSSGLNKKEMLKWHPMGMHIILTIIVIDIVVQLPLTAILMPILKNAVPSQPGMLFFVFKLIEVAIALWIWSSKNKTVIHYALCNKDLNKFKQIKKTGSLISLVVFIFFIGLIMYWSKVSGRVSLNIGIIVFCIPLFSFVTMLYFLSQKPLRLTKELGGNLWFRGCKEGFLARFKRV